MTATSGSQGVYLPPSAVPTQTRIVGINEEQDLQKDMFLKLMIAQLRNQDPTSPMDQKDMMASMTQFSQIEQMQNMAKSMETLSLTQGVGMIGKQVAYEKNSVGENGAVEVLTFTGTVESVEQRGGSIKLVLTLPEGAEPGTPQATISPSDVTKVFAS